MLSVSTALLCTAQICLISFLYRAALSHFHRDIAVLGIGFRLEAPCRNSLILRPAGRDADPYPVINRRHCLHGTRCAERFHREPISSQEDGLLCENTIAVSVIAAVGICEESQRPVSQNERSVSVEIQANAELLNAVR